MPRIPDSVLDCVIYLYASEEDAKNGEKTGGSGFIVGIPTSTEGLQWLVHLYAITNSHVVNAASTIRFRTIDGETLILNSQREDWVNHPDGDDVSLLPLGTNLDLPRIQPFTTRIFLTREDTEKVNLGPGDDVFMVGRFISHDGKQTNQPTARFGNIAMNPTPITHPHGISQESFLVEMRSLSGYSGSPVFVYLDPSYKRLHMKIPAGEETGSGWFMGIDWCHLSISEKVRDKTGTLTAEGWYVESNSGIAGVIPAWRLLDLLNVEALKMRRKQKDDELVKKAKESPVRLDTALGAGEYVEGPEAFHRFDEGMKQILSVPHTTLVRRERAYKQRSLKNPHRRGPKPRRG